MTVSKSHTKLCRERLNGMFDRLKRTLPAAPASVTHKAQILEYTIAQLRCMMTRTMELEAELAVSSPRNTSEWVGRVVASSASFPDAMIELMKLFCFRRGWKYAELWLAKGANGSTVDTIAEGGGGGCGAVAPAPAAAGGVTAAAARPDGAVSGSGAAAGGDDGGGGGGGGRGGGSGGGGGGAGATPAEIAAAAAVAVAENEDKAELEFCRSIINTTGVAGTGGFLGPLLAAAGSPQPSARRASPSAAAGASATDASGFGGGVGGDASSAVADVPPSLPSPPSLAATAALDSGITPRPSASATLAAANAALERFSIESRAWRFRPKVGVPGRVWSTMRPEWLASLADDRGTFLRAPLARRFGLRVCLAVPVTVSGNVAAVVAFYDTVARPFDPACYDLAVKLTCALGNAYGAKRSGM